MVCGYDLRPPEPQIITPRHRRPQSPAPTVVACRVCGAPNAESRQRCARCQSALVDVPQVAGITSTPTPELQPDLDREGYGPAVRAAAAKLRPTGLTLALALSGLVLIGVTLTLMVAQGIGPFGSADVDQLGTSPETGVQILGVTASSALPAHPAEHVSDGDPDTAWVQVAANPQTEDWIELRLAQSVRLRRLVVWNGNQAPDQFATRARVRSMRIEVGDERFVVELLDTRGRQVVELPRAVIGDQLRLTVLLPHPGAAQGHMALSEVEVHGSPVAPV